MAETVKVTQKVTNVNVTQKVETVNIATVGMQGAAGSQIFHGTGIPSNSLGNPTDYYLDEQTYRLYGPKLGSGVWDLSTYVSLQGKDGKSFITGTGVPLNSSGNYQDTYLDTASGNLYTKGLSGWVLQTNIINSQLLSFKYEQQSASAIWTINHNLGFNPNVNISDYGGNNVECDIEQISTNQMVLLFAEPVSGYAYLS
jgi:hypothetical protein